MKNLNQEEKNQRVVTFLNREEVDYLDKLGKDALFSTGLKVSRAKIIAWLVDFLKEINVSGEGIKSETDFETRLKNTINSHQPRPVTNSAIKSQVCNGARKATNQEGG